METQGHLKVCLALVALAFLQQCLAKEKSSSEQTCNHTRHSDSGIDRGLISAVEQKVKVFPQLDGGNVYLVEKTVKEHVCGHQDGVTYYNRVAMLIGNRYRQQQVSVRWKGSCISEQSLEKDFCRNNCSPLKRGSCGTNGVNYANVCELKEASCENRGTINLLSHGPCRENCRPDHLPCHLEIYSPVCGGEDEQSMKTFFNDCYLKVESCIKNWTGLTQHDGVCEQDLNNTVLETDGKYQSPCYDRQQQSLPIFVKSGGGKNARNFSFHPKLKVCGVDGITYQNLMVMHIALHRPENISSRIQNFGPCANGSNCMASCSPTIKKHNVVCSTNGTDHQLCQLRKKICLSGGITRPVHRGRCRPGCSFQCANVYHPVCGAHTQDLNADAFVTFANECHLKVHACLYKAEYLIKHHGECEWEARLLEESIGNMNSSLVLGTGDVLETSESEREVNATTRNDVGETIEKACQFNCPTTTEVACASDGMAYHNTCYLEMAACLMGGGCRPKLEYMGKCNDDNRLCPVKKCPDQCHCCRQEERSSGAFCLPSTKECPK